MRRAAVRFVQHVQLQPLRAANPRGACPVVEPLPLERDARGVQQVQQVRTVLAQLPPTHHGHQQTRQIGKYPRVPPLVRLGQRRTARLVRPEVVQVIALRVEPGLDRAQAL
jgi:hypothetical protein